MAVVGAIARFSLVAVVMQATVALQVLAVTVDVLVAVACQAAVIVPVDTLVAVALQAIVVPVDTPEAVALQAVVVPAGIPEAVVAPVVGALHFPSVPGHIASRSIPADQLVSAVAGVVVVLRFPQYSLCFLYPISSRYLDFVLMHARRKWQRSLPVKHIIITVFWLVSAYSF